MLRIAIDLPPERAALYRAALARLRGVEEAGSAPPDAVITANPSGDSPLPGLLDSPETCNVSRPGSQPLMPGHQWRFLPGIRAVHASLTAGQLGKPGLLRIHHWLTADLPPGQAAFAQIDLAQWFFGGTPVRLHVLKRPAYLQLHLGFDHNAMALIDLATNRPGTDSYYSLHLIGSDGAAYADDHHNTHLHLASDGTRALMHAQNEHLAILSMLKEFVAGIVEQREWSVDLLDAVFTRQLVKEAHDA